jgi:hypothetical protein
MTEILCLLLKPALLCVGNPSRYWYLVPITILAWFVDVILCRTAWAMVFGWPKRKELTISDTLERLCKDNTHPDYLLLIEIAKKINRVDPFHSHIKAVHDKPI